MALCKFFLTNSKLSNFKRVIRTQVKHFSINQFEEEVNIDEFLSDNDYLNLRQEYLKPTVHDKNIMVVQPFVRRLNTNSTPELMLEETVTLAESIPNWHVVHKFTQGLNQLNRYNVFKSSQVEKILDEFKMHNVDNVVIGLDWLNGSYQNKLENDLKCNVFDRYSMILRIFHLRATTKEAKVQTQLAEIPYIRSRLNILSKNPDHHQASVAQTVRASGKDYYNKSKFLLDKREKHLKKILTKIENSRNLINPSKKTNKVPVVGIVGYTNSGKTSLIKYFSKNQSIKPMNQLFATLDLSRFLVKLNNIQDIFILDTIGFISNIPKNLLNAFNCTLKEISDCDLIIHIYDANHPDLKNQMITVYETLFNQIKINEKLKSTIIETGNKIDLLDEEKLKELSIENPEHLFISVTKKINLQILAERIQEMLEKNLDLINRKFKVLTGSDAYQFLIENSTVKQQTLDNDNQNFSIVEVSISKKNYFQLMMLKKKDLKTS